MALTEQEKQYVANGLMRYNDIPISAANVLKVDLLAAVSATDAWIENNQASYNAALPTAFRTNATTLQKTLLFCAVALARVSIAALRRQFGEVE